MDPVRQVNFSPVNTNSRKLRQRSDPGSHIISWLLAQLSLISFQSFFSGGTKRLWMNLNPSSGCDGGSSEVTTRPETGSGLMSAHTVNMRVILLCIRGTVTQHAVFVAPTPFSFLLVVQHSSTFLR